MSYARGGPGSGVRGVVGAVVLVLGMVVVGVAQEGPDPPGDLSCLTPGRCLESSVPKTEPHGAICSTCHDLYSTGQVHATSATCATAACHGQVRDGSPFHRGVAASVLSNCLGCHPAHDARIPGGGDNCVFCHLMKRSAPRPPAHVWETAAGEPLGATFEHTEHRSLACGMCHATRVHHGAMKVTKTEDCRSCHHTSRAGVGCLYCHDRSEVAAIKTRIQHRFDIRLGRLDHPVRDLPFDHGKHVRFECTTCHTQGLALTAAGSSCSSCHEAHHQATSNCVECHTMYVLGAHTREAHLGCEGAGCHEALPASIRAVPRTRAFCLVCHQDRSDHEPDGNCALCHVLPDAAAPAGAAGRGALPHEDVVPAGTAETGLRP